MASRDILPYLPLHNKVGRPPRLDTLWAVCCLRTLTTPCRPGGGCRGSVQGGAWWAGGGGGAVKWGVHRAICALNAGTRRQARNIPTGQPSSS